MKYIALILSFILLIGCERDLPVPPQDEPYILEIPFGFPYPEIPEDGQLTKLRVELGEKLFFDTRLSRDNTISCGSCHLPDAAFADNKSLSIGIEGRIGSRNTPSLFNVAYLPYFMRDGGVRSLESQVLVPLEDHNEMDLELWQAVKKVAQDENYKALSKAAYDRPFDAFVLTRALAAFERTLISGNSRADEYIYLGKENALTAAEKSGFELFKLHCNSCHSGFNFTDNEFKNNGLYLNYDDIGRARITLENGDIGKFRTPSLRNIALTAPYMHDGSLGSLAEVIEHYNSGGKQHPNKSGTIKPLSLNKVEKDELISFLRALTDKK